MAYIDWEIMGDAWDAFREWEDYEADLENGDPWA